MTSIGDRMKLNYEKRFTYSLIRRIPVIIRVDGHCFHSYCRGLNKPFDKKFMSIMDCSAFKVAENIQGFKLAYIQSDEVSFLLNDYDRIETDAWFDYNKSKIETISASMMTMYFNDYVQERMRYHNKLAHFDARAFNVPKDEVANYFIWRSRDWERNSIQMYARTFYSHKELHGKNREEIHELLHEKNKNWATLDHREKNGMFIIKQERGLNFYQPENRLNYEEINQLIIDSKNEDY